MKPKEKSKEVLNSFLLAGMSFDLSVKCALIAVDLVLETDLYVEDRAFWEKVWTNVYSSTV